MSIQMPHGRGAVVKQLDAAISEVIQSLATFHGVCLDS